MRLNWSCKIFERCTIREWSYGRYAATVAMMAGMVAGGWTLLPAAATHHSSQHSSSLQRPGHPPTAVLLHSTQETAWSPIMAHVYTNMHHWLQIHFDVKTLCKLIENHD